MIRSISTRALVLFLGGVGLTVGILGVVAFHQQKALLNRQAERSATNVMTVIRLMLEREQELRVSGELQRLLQSIDAVSADVSRISVVNPALTVIADSDPRRVGTVTTQTALAQLLAQPGDLRFYYESGGRRFLRIARTMEGRWDPVRRSAVMGVIAVDLRLDYLDERIRAAQWFYLSMSAAIGLALAILMYVVAQRSLVRPLQTLQAAARRVERGDLDARVDLKRSDELGDLAAGWNAAIEARENAETALQAATADARGASRAKGDFLATMTHELRTPFNAVIGFTDLLLDTPLTPQQREYAESTRASAEKLLGTVNDVLDVSRIEAGRLDLEHCSFDVEELAQQVTRQAGRQAMNTEVTVVLRVAPGTPRRAVGDETRVREILTNLASNAVKFTARGHVIVFLEGRRDGALNRYRFSVEDTGIGIPADQQRAVFERFTQADTSTARRFGGSGLGLAIARGLTELMGGRIGVESAPGQGSTFWFELALPPGEPTEDDGPAGDLQHLRVLVAEDDPVRIRVALETMASWGMAAEAAVTAPEALARLRSAVAAESPFDLVIVDQLLPGMEAAELARAIRNDATLTGTKLLLLSSLAASARPVAEGLFDVGLVRPVTPSAMRRAIEALFRRARRPDDSPDAGVARLASSGTHALLLDDSLLNQRVAVAMLEKLGCRVDVARTGAEAIDAVAGSRYDIVLMDCQMPDMDGLEATRRIRSQEGESGEGAHTPIVALTALSVTGQRERCLAAGMDDFIAKPVRLPALAAVLERHARVPRQPGQSVAAEPPPAALDVNAARPLPPLIGELYAVFRDTGPADVAALRDAMSRGDAASVRRTAHRLKGALGHFGRHGGLVPGGIAAADDGAAIAAVVEVWEGGEHRMADIDVLAQRVDEVLAVLRRAWTGEQVPAGTGPGS